MSQWTSAQTSRVSATQCATGVIAIQGTAELSTPLDHHIVGVTAPDGLDVPLVPGVERAPHDLNVLLRHRPPSIPPAAGERRRKPNRGTPRVKPTRVPWTLVTRSTLAPTANSPDLLSRVVVVTYPV